MRQKFGGGVELGDRRLRTRVQAMTGRRVLALFKQEKKLQWLIQTNQK
jgi:hypothetical protein